MISFILKRVSKLTSTASLLSLLGATLLVMVFLNLFCGPRIHHDPLDKELGGYNVSTVERVLAAYGQDGRKAYMIYVTPADMIFCWLYTVYLSAQLIRLYGWQRRSLLADVVVKIITISPFIAGLSDFLENFYMFALAYYYPLSKSHDWLVPIFSTLTMTKWGVAIGAIVLILLGLIKSCLFGSSTKPKSH